MTDHTGRHEVDAQVEQPVEAGATPSASTGDPEAGAAESAATAPGPEGGPGLARPVVSDLEPADLETLATQTLDQLEAVTAERDDYLDRLRRLQADFENFKKRSARELQEAGERAKARLADELLPVLDACDAGLMHGATGVEPVFTALLGVLEKEGLERIDPLGAAFDPARHEAVLHEPADDGQDESLVVEVLRPGYAWNGQVIRAAMVKVRG